MNIVFYFDVFIGRKQNLIKRIIKIDTGNNKPSEQNLFNAIDEVSFELIQTYGPGFPFSIINTKTEYFLLTKH